MRSNSGSGKSTNNNHDPTLRDHERAKGVSGTAIQRGEGTGHPDRKPTPRVSPDRSH
jgi:hypothetical protein